MEEGRGKEEEEAEAQSRAAEESAQLLLEEGAAALAGMACEAMPHAEIVCRVAAKVDAARSQGMEECVHLSSSIRD